MKVLTINGSPKGKNSITYQTVLYLEKCFPEHTFDVLHVGQQIRVFEKDMSEALNKMVGADLILFSYPVYTFIAPSQLHQFISLVKKSGVDLSGKYVTQISTSKHFYDVTAHRYIQDNCQEMKMHYLKGLSADMEDLTKKKGQKEAEAFFKYVCWCMEKNIFESVPPQIAEPDHFIPCPAEDSISVKNKPKKKTRKPVVIVTDCGPEDENLQRMINRFRYRLPVETKLVNLREFPFTGGCLGCFHCAVTGACIYKDGFDTFLREEIQSGMSIIYAFSIKDHSMGPLFKMYDDRQFCNGHRTVTMGMPMGYLVSGPYHKEENLRMIVEGRAEVGGNFLAGVATDEEDPDGQIDALARKLMYALKEQYKQPQNFYGVGGMKIFRDLIYQMQGMMRADHKFYKAHGQYDFPQKKKGTIIGMYLVGAMMSNPVLQKKISPAKMTEGMLMPYKAVIERK